MKRFLIPFVLLFLLLVSGCNTGSRSPQIAPSETVSPDLYDISWLTGDPCYAPCWYGLEVDVSTEDQALEVLKSLPFVDYSTLEEWVIGFSDPLTEEVFDAKRIYVSKIGDSRVSMVFDDQLLKIISVGLNYEISLGAVVEQLGDPDVIRVGFPQPELEGCEVELYWLEMQLMTSYLLDSESADWRGRCEGAEKNKPLDSSQGIEYFEIIFQNWITAMLGRDEGNPWPGFIE